MSTLTLRKATRTKTKIRVGLSGPSGSGKTYSALLLASGIAAWDKIAVIDTENGSGELYANLGDYSVITLTAPFTPERYIEAIDACQKAGIDVIIIDSASHEWDGKGGCLESNELLGQTKFKGNNWAAWSVTTPRHQKFIEAIVASQCHIITTARSKTDTIQTEDKKIKKVGLKEIQREGFEYELTLNFTLDRDGHYATASKDRTGMFINNDPFKITPETGAKILEWTLTGAEPTQEPPSPTSQQLDQVKALCKELGKPLKDDKLLNLNGAQVEALIKQLEAEKSAKVLATVPPAPAKPAEPQPTPEFLRAEMETFAEEMRKQPTEKELRNLWDKTIAPAVKTTSQHVALLDIFNECLALLSEEGIAHAERKGMQAA